MSTASTTGSSSTGSASSSEKAQESATAASSTTTSSADSAFSSMTVRALADHINNDLILTQKDRRVQALWQGVNDDIRIGRLHDAQIIVHVVNLNAFTGECKDAMTALRKKLDGK